MKYEEQFNKLAESLRDNGITFSPKMSFDCPNREEKFKEILEIIDAIRSGNYIDSTDGYDGRKSKGKKKDNFFN